MEREQCVVRVPIVVGGTHSRVTHKSSAMLAHGDAHLSLVATCQGCRLVVKTGLCLRFASATMRVCVHCLEFRQFPQYFV
jgi:hypothetical protein